MSVYIPCLNPDSGDSQSGSGIQLVTPASIESGLVSLAGQAIPVTIGETVLWLNPITAIASFAINWRFWADLFGLGETRIDREKQQIQDVLTSIFQYLNFAYNVPIRDGHALQFPSDGVQSQFAQHPEIAALVPQLLQTSPIVTANVFADTTPTSGEQERTVNQFLANAAINEWPPSATVAIWDGLVDAANAQCSSDPNRWLKNPLIPYTAGRLAAILQYIPLNVLLDMAVSHHIGDPLMENLIQLWAQNPQLIQYLPQITGQPWQAIYTEGRWALPPYGTSLGTVIPLLSRDHIQPILSSVTVPRPQFPDFGVVQQPPPPPIPQPVPQPTPQPTPTPVPQNPPLPPVPQPPAEPPPQQPYSQAWLDYACRIWRLRAGNSPLSGAELGFTGNSAYIDLQNQAGASAQCHVPLYRATPDSPTYDTPPQPTPTPQPPSPTPGQGGGQQPPSQQDLVNYACWISRLLYGNSPMSPAELEWLSDPQHVALVQSVLNNPTCQQPLRRNDPTGQGDPFPLDCPPVFQSQLPGEPSPGQQPSPIPPGQPGGEPPLDQTPCPPDCLQAIDRVRQQSEDCCDEVHTIVLPKLYDLEHFRDWVYTTFNVPLPAGEQPLPTYPGDGEPIPPGVPPDAPQPTSDHLPPITDCNSIFVTTLLACVLPKLPPVTPTTPGLCQAIIDCIDQHCEEVRDKLKKCEQKDLTTNCEEGIAKWGKWAECWLNANTPAPDTWPIDAVQPFTRESLSALANGILANDTNALLAFQIERAHQMAFRILKSDYSDVGTSPYEPLPRPTFIFENVAALTGGP